jgi:hypothetical protein
MMGAKIDRQAGSECYEVGRGLTTSAWQIACPVWMAIFNFLTMLVFAVRYRLMSKVPQ